MFFLNPQVATILISCLCPSIDAGWISTGASLAAGGFQPGLVSSREFLKGSQDHRQSFLHSTRRLAKHARIGTPATLLGANSRATEVPESSFGDQVVEALSTQALNNTSSNSNNSSSNTYGLTDDAFEAWIGETLTQENPWMANMYPDIFAAAPRCITQWRRRFRGNPALWKRIFKRDRVVKEFLEAAPILQAVVQMVDATTLSNDQDDPDAGKFTIVDLASGKGYLSMILSELLPPEKLTKIVLIDKAWPMCGSMPQPHHMNWDHIYGNHTTAQDDDTATNGNVPILETGGSVSGTYFATWPIPLHTSKQDLKQKCNLRQLKKRLFDTAPGPVIVLAIHLCGLLSLRAVDLFNDNPDTIQFLALKPCCLPTIIHAKRDEIFSFSNGHSFDSKLVCSSGSWSSKEWHGPPRWHLEPKFNAWADNLYLGIATKQKVQARVKLQQDGGYQNVILFAEREPIITPNVWDGLLLLESNGDEKLTEE